jgi:hypothetical protein
MNKITPSFDPVKPRPADTWPSSPELDGFTWELEPEPTRPSEDDARWVAVGLVQKKLVNFPRKTP